MEHRRAQDRRYGEQKGEPGRRIPVHAGDKPARNGGTAAADTGDDCQPLHGAHEQGIQPADTCELPFPRANPLGDKEDHGGCDQPHRGIPGRMEERFEGVLEGQGDDHRGHRAENQQPAHPPHGSTTKEVHHHRSQVPAEIDQYRRQGAQVHRDLEDDGLALDPQQVVAQHQVAGGGDGQELGQALD